MKDKPEKPRKKKLNKSGNRMGMHVEGREQFEAGMEKKGIPLPIPKFPNPDGRPPKLTEDLIAEFGKLLVKTYYLETVARYLGLDSTSIRIWRARGKEQYEKLRDDENASAPVKGSMDHLTLLFFMVVRCAMADAEIRAIKRIDGDPSWQSQAWKLERWFPERYGSQNHVVRQLQKDLNDLMRKLDGLDRKERKDD